MKTRPSPSFYVFTIKSKRTTSCINLQLIELFGYKGTVKNVYKP